MLLTYSGGISAYSDPLCPIRTFLSLHLLLCLCVFTVTGLEKGPGTPPPSKSRASRAHPQHQRCPCTHGWGCCPQGCPPAGILQERACLETCVEPLRLRQMIGSKYPPRRSCAMDVTAASARRDLPKGASVEGMGTARGPGIHHHPGQSCRCSRQLKLPEGSKAVDVREARSRRNFIHCVMFLSVCTGRVAISGSSLSCCHIT